MDWFGKALFVLVHGLPLGDDDMKLASIFTR
jgi:hypothetical protein